MKRSDIPIEPCARVSWSDLEPSGRDRRCDRCGKDVVDLSARTRREARRLLSADPAGERPCVAYRTDAGGNVRFQPSRARRWAAVALGVLAALPLRAVAREAVDVEVGTGREPDAPERIDFGGYVASMYDVEAHPHRFPHGPHGPSWVAVGAGIRGAIWKRVVLACDGIRERHPMPDDGYLRFETLPEGRACELRFRGGAPPLDVSVTTGSDEDGEWRRVVVER